MNQAATEMSTKVQVSGLAKKMLRYRWVCYGILLFTYVFVYEGGVRLG